MHTTIDGAGRVVVPKPLRDALGLVAGTSIEIEERDGHLVLRVPDGGGHWEERDGRRVLVAPEGTPPLTVEMVRAMVERERR